MSHQDAPISEVPTSVLIDRIAVGWQPPHSGLAQEFVQRWASHFSTSVEVKEIGNSILHFTTDLSKICLRGTDNIPCLMIGGGRDVVSAVRDFWHRVSSRPGVSLILSLSEPALVIARASFPSGRCLVLTSAQIKQLLKTDEPHTFLKQLLWREIPKRRLSPYNQLVPAEGSIFVGRKNELARLTEQDDLSTAIAGPGRIGKTSLVRRYRQQMILGRDPRVACRFYISFYDCDGSSPEAVARFFAMRVDPSSRSNRIKPHELASFIKFQRHKLGGPLDLLLDEVDLVCNSEALRFLGVAAREGDCRLVLCGRGVLLKTILSSSSPLECRIDLMQLEPLDSDAALQLILKPLADLGFRIKDPERFAERLLRLTGRLPHLIQFCGQKLVEDVIEHRSGILSEDYIDRLEADFVTAQYFMKPLNDLTDPLARLVALSVLKERVREFPIALVQAVADRAGVSISHSRALEICNELVVNNVFAWNNGSYCVANEGLYFYAKKMGALGEPHESVEF